MPRILLVDDNDDWRSLIERRLIAKGHTVFSAVNGVEALKILESRQVDVMITDVVMPDMDGFELFMTLREKPDRPCVIVMSGGAYGLDGANLLHMSHLMGAEKNLLKPFGFADLETAIAEVLVNRSVIQPDTVSPHKSLEP
ncbi:MAG TPA: response regulator [Desulfuromonadales bacterium]|nr:response regulator [Desulfuromonadales bacterium]